MDKGNIDLVEVKKYSGQMALKRITNRRNMISKRVKITTEEILMFRNEGRK
jgi:hypothetical protein